MFASGPFVAEEGALGDWAAMTILRAGSATETQSILDEDPFVREGAVSVTPRKWLVMEGSVRVTLRFSDQSAQIL